MTPALAINLFASPLTMAPVAAHPPAQTLNAASNDAATASTPLTAFRAAAHATVTHDTLFADGLDSVLA
jgi:hypothetical protein